jgi:hypothetical protein
MRTLTLPLLTAWLAVGCGEPTDPMADLDATYTDIMVDLAITDRDTARNVRNKQARERKAKAEKARVAFFRHADTKRTIDEARKEAKGTLTHTKGTAYHRHQLMYGSWTESEKAEETRLLGRLEEAATEQATWTSADGKVEANLSSSWGAASKPADELTATERADLAQHFAEHRMGVLGTNLQDLVQLRNTVAQRAGFANYWELALEAQGLSPHDVDKVIRELTQVVQDAQAEIKARVDAAATDAGLAHSFENRPLLRRKAGLSAGRDIADSFFDTDLAEARVSAALSDLGFATEGRRVGEYRERDGKLRTDLLMWLDVG